MQFSIVKISYATIYTLSGQGETVVGDVTTTFSREEDTLLDIARAHGLGYQDIKLFNPTVDTWLPGEGSEIQLPSKFILPKTQQAGLVLNIPEMRLYHYFKNDTGDTVVETYPLGVGREGWSTPYMKTKIVEKKANPNWYPPKSIKEEHANNGDPLPDIVKAGPDNPLGAYAMRLGRREYLIHGTNRPFGVGMRVSHGCIRLYPEDIEKLFQQVKVGTRVEIVNQPYKVGVRDGVLYLEAHPYLEEDSVLFENNITPIVELIIDETREDEYDIDWDKVREVSRSPNGVPVAIGIKNLGNKVLPEKDLILAKVGNSAPEPLNQLNKLKTELNTLKNITSRAIETQENKLQLRLDTILGR